MQWRFSRRGAQRWARPALLSIVAYVALLGYLVYEIDSWRQSTHPTPPISPQLGREPVSLVVLPGSDRAALQAEVAELLGEAMAVVTEIDEQPHQPPEALKPEDYSPIDRADVAARVAASLANEKCLRQWGTAPFSPESYPAVLQETRWQWGHCGDGRGRFSAEVFLGRQGKVWEVHVYANVDGLNGPRFRAGGLQK